MHQADLGLFQVALHDAAEREQAYAIVGRQTKPKSECITGLKFSFDAVTSTSNQLIPKHHDLLF